MEKDHDSHYLERELTELGFYRDDGGKLLAELGKDSHDSAVRALAVILREIQGYSPADAYNIAYASISTENARWEAKARKPRRHITRVGRRGTRFADKTVPRKVYEKVFDKYGLAKVPRGKGLPWLTYSEAYRIYGDCIVSSKGFVSAIIGGKLHDTIDWRDYEVELRDEYDYETDTYLVDIRERKAGAIWAAGTEIEPCPGWETPWQVSHNDAWSARQQETRGCNALLTRRQQDAFRSLTGQKREIKERELKAAYYAGAEYPYPLLWEPGTRRPPDWESRIEA